MKKIIIALLVCALAALPALAEGFGFREGIAWGMALEEAREAEDMANAEVEREAGFDVLEIEDVEVNGFPCDLEYFFRDDALMACTCDYGTEDGAGFDALLDALTAAHGAPEPDADPERWRVLEDILYGEMDDRPADSFACWTLEDGTFIALVEDAGDASITLGFYDELKLVESYL